MRKSKRLFAGVYPTGIVYADTAKEEHGDYKTIAFLSYRTLILEWWGQCPRELKKEIETEAAIIQAQRGQFFSTSTCGQGVILGQ